MSKTNQLLEQLRALPSFNNLESAIKKALTSENFYVEHFKPEADGYYDEKDDDGKQVCIRYHLDAEQREDEAIENLIDDNSSYFDEFIHDDDIRFDVTEFMRDIIKEIRKC